MSEPMAKTPESEGRTYRLTHLMEDIADAFGEWKQHVAPLKRGGLNPRVQNRATFTINRDAPNYEELNQRAEHTLNTHAFAWTTGSITDDGTNYVVLGRTISDLRELRAGDYLNLNKRRGPFRVYRVLEQDSGPEVLRKSTASVTAELVNVDTDTDWMLVQWDTAEDPVLYVRTKDKSAKSGYRYRKVEDATRTGRVGPMRRFTVPEDKKADVERHVPREVERARDHYLGENRTIHPEDLDRVERLFRKPVAEAFTAEDATLVRDFLGEMADWHERQAGGLTLETDEDKALAATRQEDARTCRNLAGTFDVLQMDAVDVPTDPDAPTAFYVHSPCGVGYVDRFRYSKHAGLCDAPTHNHAADGESA